MGAIRRHIGGGTLVVAVAVAAAGAAGGAWTAFSGGNLTLSSPPVRTTHAVLTAYNSCDALLGDLKARALDEVGPYGFVLSAGGRGAAFSGAAVPSTSAGAASGAMATSQAPVQGAYSTTNDQEAGVDEPDLAKTDGRLLVAVRHSPAGVEVVDVAGRAPTLAGFVATPQLGAAQLFLTGADAVVIGQGPWSGSSPGPSSQVVVVSLADPQHPTVVRSFDVQGAEVAARLIGGRVVVVAQGQPTLPFVYPSGGSESARAAALAANRAAIESSTLADWLPSVTVNPGGQTYRAGCQEAMHAAGDPGLGMVSVLSIDPASARPGPELTVVGQATAVYASSTGLYVADSRGGPSPVVFGGALPQGAAGANVPAPGYVPAGSGPGAVTDIHAFDLSDPSQPRYVGSGSVDGNLLGQYSMSEFQGDLRVATTVGVATPPPGEGSAPAGQSDSRVTVLAPRGGVLVPVGSIGGLGAGEKIYGVRFVGPYAYVVTFRQTDPLYVVDLADPAHPVLDGQLALTGFSSFLQPLGGSLLLGVGQQVDANLRQSGLQLSVFDLADTGSPRLASRAVLDGSTSPAQTDPHALLWWPERRLVAAPVYSSGGTGTPFAGLIVWQVAADGSIHEVARLAQPAGAAPGPCTCPPGVPCSCPAIAVPTPAGPGAVVRPYSPGVERAVVVGHLMLTVSDSGIMATDMDTWAEAAWLPYAPTS